jgi:hypothetical protein
MTLRTAEPIIAVILCVLCVFAWIHTGSMSSGAQIFPRMILAALGVLSVIYLVRSVMADSSINEISLDKKKFVFILLITTSYVSSFIFVGYFTATFFYIPAVCYALGFRRLLYIFIADITFLLSVYILFVYSFGRAVPRELLFQIFG